jgi:hypothetical protein
MRILLFLAALVAAVPAQAQLIIAHRGASGERPEHTLAAYERAIDAGADFIEPDLVVTRDLVLVARHENELSDSTDVASREEFAERRQSKEIDGQLVSGWFAEDFTLAELRTLRAKERLPGLRPANARFDGLYQVPTFAEIVALLRAKKAETGRTVGLYPELKHPTFLLQQGIDSVDLFVGTLKRGRTRRKGDSPVRPVIRGRPAPAARQADRPPARAAGQPVRWPGGRGGDVLCRDDHAHGPGARCGVCRRDRAGPADAGRRRREPDRPG